MYIFRRVTSPHVHGLAISPDGAHLFYAARTSDDALVALDRDAFTGDLTFIEALYDRQGGVAGLNDPRQVAVSPDGDHVYVASYGDNSLAVFRREAATGQLQFLQALKDGVAGADGLSGVKDVAISSGGNHDVPPRMVPVNRASRFADHVSAQIGRDREIAADRLTWPWGSREDALLLLTDDGGGDPLANACQR
jgi:hypothetical protein